MTPGSGLFMLAPGRDPVSSQVDASEGVFTQTRCSFEERFLRGTRKLLRDRLQTSCGSLARAPASVSSERAFACHSIIFFLQAAVEPPRAYRWLPKDAVHGPRAKQRSGRHRANQMVPSTQMDELCGVDG